MASKLPDSIYSQDQLLVCAEELHKYGAALSKKAKEAPEISNDAQDLLSLLPAEKRTDPATIEQLRSEMEQIASGWPVVTLVTAAPAPRAVKQELVSWLRQKVKPTLLANFHVNPEIAGGLVVRTTNHIYDSSFRTLLLSKPAEFTKVLDHV